MLCVVVFVYYLVILHISATYFSVAVALPDSEPPGMCIYTSMPEETSNDVGISNTLLDDRCVDSLVEVPWRSLNFYYHDRLSMIWKARVWVMKCMRESIMNV